ncbi:hypothetical protein DAPPUDRAFT_320263 [Daphnia pulex]|uniref:Uncharacterized protein n=1 Tax=Daphnia pulex TaxID=6669 RepID=E9GPD4_DAPPU|nr:hypothetical protein DAPPUDRAFT_320263 [Daphnia pulex]|eukprot:EFX78621.1 hypothetical protein DAPPUDRAFT_320263 [Daphnia pulex]
MGFGDAKLAYSLNLDASKIGKGPDICVHVKQMRCPANFLEMFNLMYETIEQEDDHIIFREASLFHHGNF